MDELICMLASGDLSPHIICLSEHYLYENNLIMMISNAYYLASKFAHQSYTGGSVSMLIKLNLGSYAIDLTQYCIEKVIEACVAQIKIGFQSIIMHIQVS
jgi:hypothetical protein